MEIDHLSHIAHVYAPVILLDGNDHVVGSFLAHSLLFVNGHHRKCRLIGSILIQALHLSVLTQLVIQMKKSYLMCSPF